MPPGIGFLPSTIRFRARDVAKVDAHVRKVMQTALDRLARRRRLPLIG
jgi:hypothetical protein